MIYDIFNILNILIKYINIYIFMVTKRLLSVPMTSYFIFG